MTDETLDPAEEPAAGSEGLDGPEGIVIVDPAGLEAAQPRDDGDVSLLALIDRLSSLLDRSDLTELAVESGGTGIVLRKAVAVTTTAAAAPAAGPAATEARHPAAETTGSREPGPPSRPSVKAPLTGIFYASPAPGSGPYVQVGGEVAVGQVVGLIEAMKLFNEIKSDLAGRVVKVIPESGTLVKAKQPLVEVDPL